MNNTTSTFRLRPAVNQLNQIFEQNPPRWYTPLVTWLISVPPLIWVGISTLTIIIALFRLKIIKIEIEKPLEPAEELQHQINTLLQPLTEKDKRFIPLQRFLRQLLKNNPPPETIEFLQSTFPTIIHSLQEDLTYKRGERVKDNILTRDDLKRNTESEHEPKETNRN